MYLDEIVQIQNHGKARGLTSICSVHPLVLRAAMLQNAAHLLIEATCNQVNQFGGYTGMKPADFVSYVHAVALANHFPLEKLVLSGDHLGPNVWKNEPVDSAMETQR